MVELVVRNLPANTGNVRDVNSVYGLGRSPGEGHGKPLLYSCLKNLMDGEVWRATIQSIESQRVRHD